MNAWVLGGVVAASVLGRMHALARVPGIGGAKLARYGEDVLEVLLGQG